MILNALYKSVVVCVSICVEITLCTVITFTVDELSGEINTQFMFVIRRRKIIADVSRMDVVFGLFGYIGFMRRLVKQVSSPAKFVNRMIFHCEFVMKVHIIIGFQSQIHAIQFSDFGKPVAIVIESAPITRCTKKHHTCLHVLRYQRSIQRQIIIGRIASY